MENMTPEKEGMNVIEPGTKPGIIPQATPDFPYWRMWPFGYISLIFLYGVPYLFHDFFEEKIDAPDGAELTCFIWCAVLTIDQFGALKASLKRKQLKRFLHGLFTLAICLWVSYDSHYRLEHSTYETRFDVYASCRAVIVAFIMRYAKFW